MTPREVMDRFWRFKRVRDRIDLELAGAMRAAFGSDAKEWKTFRRAYDPLTQEIDPPPGRDMPKRKPRTKKPVTLEELDNDD